jgi:hypothetical protein
MLNSSRHHTTFLIGTMMLSVAWATGGCTSTGGGEKLAQSFSRTRGFLADSQGQVDETLSRLQALRMTDATNLNNAFSQYKQAVAGLEKKGNEAKQLAAAMQDNMETNTMNWQKEMESIQDPTVKASVESRREAVRSNYDQLKTYAQDARNAYEPFLTDNQDIVKALSMNLSPAAVSGMASKFDRTAADGKTLKQKIAAMQRAMDNITKGQPPIATAGTP